LQYRVLWFIKTKLYNSNAENSVTSQLFHSLIPEAVDRAKLLFKLI